MKKYFTKEYILANKKQMLRYGILVIIAMAALFVFVFKTGDSESIPLEKTQVEASTEKEENTAKTIIVDVSGQVNVPQVIELDSGSRVSDAIDAAGGLTEKADISGINRAAEISDGEKIYIPAKGETNSQVNGSTIQGDGSAGTSGTSSVEKGKININTASNSELQTLNGVGPATAEKILLYRSKNGNFTKLEDLKNVNGIGEKIFEKLKPYITI